MAMSGKKAPKSRKADGTPKKRWSAADRAAKGAKPRSSGGQRPYEGSRPYVKRDDRRSSDASSPRSESGRDDRAPREERRSYEGRDSGSPDRRSFDRNDRNDRSSGFSSDRRASERSGSSGDRRSFDRNDRPSSSGRGGFGERRGSGFNDRNRDDRGSERRNGGFNDRPRYDSRNDDRPSYQQGSSSDRGFQGRSREDRPRFEDRRSDNRGAGSFDDRGARRSDDRGARSFDDRGPRRSDDRGARSFDDRGPRRSDDRGARSFDDRGPRRFDDRNSRGSDDRRSGFGDSARRGASGDHRDRSHQPRRDSRQDFGQDSGNPESDQMSWTASEVADVEVSEAHQASGFAELGVKLPLVAQLEARGITVPFPIQQATIVDGIAGRDVLGRGRTGSGKTLAFGLSLLSRLSDGRPSGTPRAMILTPTRELALQIADDLSALAHTVGLRLTLVTGGMSFTPQIRAFDRGVDIVVATPGRLIDLIEQGAADLSQVEITVLDEADHMSDLGFMPAVTTLLDAVPSDGQRMLFSATLDGAVDRLVRKFLHDPVTHEVDSSKNSVTTLSHHLLQLAPHHKNAITAEIANRAGKTVVFARTQLGVERISGQLREAGVMAGGLHGGLTQGARARVLAAFKGEDLPVLVATDVAARGIHVDDVSLVLQVDPPMNSKDYLHRAGRTARAGESGAVVSIVLPHQRKEMRRISGQAGVHVDPTDVAPDSDELREATGSRVPAGAPISEAEYQRLIGPKQQPRRPQNRGGGGGGFRKRSGGGGGHGGGRNRNWK